ncbi:MAG: hypothetical protein D6741_21465 [Planctomycetota bacterium]|nr:MAG: hypothetical protein D6741_21465 [Planctomycetota bacterium]
MQTATMLFCAASHVGGRHQTAYGDPDEHAVVKATEALQSELVRRAFAAVSPYVGENSARLNRNRPSANDVLRCGQYTPVHYLKQPTRPKKGAASAGESTSRRNWFGQEKMRSARNPFPDGTRRNEAAALRSGSLCLRAFLSCGLVSAGHGENL